MTILTDEQHGTPWQPLLDELAEQRATLDLMTAAWAGEYRGAGGRLFCTAGCRSCCSLAVNCTLTEAVDLAAILTTEQAGAVAGYVQRLRDLTIPLTDLKSYLRMQRSEMGWCPLLGDDGCCMVYPLRPLSCRALLSTKEPHWCGADFGTLPPEEKQAFVASLDRSVVAFPLHYAAFTQDSGRELEERLLVRMREQFGIALYGNLPVLLHLVLAWRIQEILSAGPSAVEELLSRAGLDHPFLVERLS
ncbi:YkgJ family cysteine cluster protein [Trichlorobacter ammonificans]|uniref:YkgJ family cysteine cluster protein n=1 Tax=Trichlorobacter ammonificans TaxID=2916410 RepID=A0ABN8HN59_9BACT|nr:YkgJ family cysteine cluster protein [Trichlorobacter ammonificans]CAH2032413.1 conserved protein of unknown function [Trichlorobacter ammonificans]